MFSLTFHIDSTHHSDKAPRIDCQVYLKQKIHDLKLDWILSTRIPLQLSTEPLIVDQEYLRNKFLNIGIKYSSLL